MSLNIGIVGLPNVGKSTLFNALTRQHVVAENYPFATIDPNVGVVAVPDERLGKLAAIEHSKKIVPTIIEFVDIAGLVKDAHKGEGLGNQFLSHIREVDAVAQVVRLFEDERVHHVENSVNGLRDIETINTELVLADLSTLQKRLATARSDAKSQDKEKLAAVAALEKMEGHLSAGNLAIRLPLAEEEQKYLSDLHLLTLKPQIYVANISGTDSAAAEKLLREKIPQEMRGQVVAVDVKQEAELAEFSDEEKSAFLKEAGIAESGLDKLIKAAYQTLGLITFLTTGPDETRAWTVTVGSTAPVAAGKIHTDFEKGFIKAEVIDWKKLLETGSWNLAREKGWVRTEGRDYVMADGDVVFFKFNV
jgi:GTP-binding protein YchF